MPPRRDLNAVPTNAELAQTVQLLTQLTHTIANAVLQNNQPRNNGSDMETRVAARNPPSFLGQEDPIILENWIRTFDKLFDAINCPVEQRIDIAVYYLHEEADKWWVNAGPGLRAQPDFTWERFKQALRKRFYPPHVQAENYDKFLHLKQGEMTVQEYHTKFVSLAEFASSLVPDEESKVEKFVRGLNYDTQKALSVQECQTLDDAYYRAAKHYRVIQLQREAHKKIRKNEEENKAKEKRLKTHHEEQQLPWKRDNRPHEGRRFFGLGPKQNHQSGTGDRHFHCWKCKRDHPGVDCDGKLVNCFNCGKMGHRSFECLSKLKTGPQNQGNNRGGGNQPGAGANRVNNNRGNGAGDANRTPNQNHDGGNNNKNNAPNQGRIYVMNQAQARAHDVVADGYALDDDMHAYGS
ncbi:unnamed protein product [Cuscuta europaea]|uniref:CCHC-type domain-containing protein n=1 Tax=Cuscuta europaea TaxID=41803 RepID=A0A9P1EM71_CUSEU|nr:unnamed protein product [Cuscuta europaea]CAH9115627.1 unnamed protein product [Cuscuta europaea]